jgi:oligoendopeptidase F
MEQNYKVNIVKERHYLPQQIEIRKWDDIKDFYDELKSRLINSVTELEKWMMDRAELEAFVQEDAGWRYIRMTCDANNEKLTEDFNFFITEIEPKIAPYSNDLNKKLMQCDFLKSLDQDKYFIYLRGVKKALELFREVNIPLIAEMQSEQNKYGSITSSMTIHFEGQEYTMQQASKFFKETDRNVREKIYHLVQQRRLEDKEKLDLLFDKLIKLRHQIAINAGYSNYRDYKFQELGRFDYTKENCFEFHDAIQKEIVPILDSFDRERKIKLELDSLRPWDMDVDTDGLPPLKPFQNGDELLGKTIECFTKVNPEFADYLFTMKQMKHLDLESRKGKAPGGYNYPLYESKVPFIFMNAVGTMNDVETMVHEGGHAIHSFLSSHLPSFQIDVPSEVAELASMSMEFISMEHWETFLNNSDELKRAKKEQLQSSLKTLTWVATIDKFQHWLYTHPEHTHQERDEMWASVFHSFNGSAVDWSGLQAEINNMWQKQLHLFEVPFYYIEYAMAQLGAIAMWKCYKENPVETIENYKKALSLGYTKSIPELYKAAGIAFDFSQSNVRELALFIKKELELLQ